MAFMEINGVTLHYRRGARRDGRALVFVNSLGTDYRIWRQVAHALGGRFATLYHDKRGHGLSSRGRPPGTMADHVNDLAALMDAEGMKEAIICGISVGGQVALGLSQARPDLAAGLVLCDTAHKIGAKEAWDARIAQVAAEGLTSVWPMTEKAWFTEAFRRERAAETAGYRAMVTRCDPGGYINTCMAIRDADYTEAARALRIPALALCGAEDGSTPPALVKSMAEIIPGCRYEEIENAAHMTCIEQPGRVAELIAAFAADNNLE